MKRGHLTGRWLAAALTAAVFSAASLSGCAGEEKGADTGNGASGEKEITVAVNSETGTLDPAGSIALTYLSYSVTALDELLTYDENGEIEYRAAESYEVNEDSTVWTFHLRENALWSDGTPVTAEDFLNTIRRALDPASGSGYAMKCCFEETPGSYRFGSRETACFLYSEKHTGKRAEGYTMTSQI